MERLAGPRTVPQIFIDGHSFGGYDDIRRLDATGELDRVLGDCELRW
jgi:glutaredoxin